MLQEQIESITSWDKLKSSTTLEHVVKLLTKEEKDRIYRKKRNLVERETLERIKRDNPDLVAEVKKQYENI